MHINIILKVSKQLSSFTCNSLKFSSIFSYGKTPSLEAVADAGFSKKKAHVTVKYS
jgi:hypothetical protein